MTLIPTPYGEVEIAEHTPRDFELGRGDRMRQDFYAIAFNGHRYNAVAGASWDSPHQNRHWQLESLTRQASAVGRYNWRTEAQPRSHMVRVPRGQKAWQAIDVAVHEHRRKYGYAQAPKELAS